MGKAKRNQVCKRQRGQVRRKTRLVNTVPTSPPPPIVTRNMSTSPPPQPPRPETRNTSTSPPPRPPQPETRNISTSPPPERLDEEERHWTARALDVVGEVYTAYKIVEKESEEHLTLANNIRHQKEHQEQRLQQLQLQLLQQKQQLEQQQHQHHQHEQQLQQQQHEHQQLLQEELANLGTYSATLGQEVEKLKEEKVRRCRQLAFINAQNKMTNEKVVENLAKDRALIQALQEEWEETNTKLQEKERIIEELRARIEEVEEEDEDEIKSSSEEEMEE